MFDSNIVAGVSAAIVSLVVGYTIAKLPIGRKLPSSALILNAPQKQSAIDEKMDKIFSNMRGEYKMVLVVRNDLKMGKGKIAAQCGHAAVGAFESAMQKTPKTVNKWRHSGQAKIALKVENEADLIEIYHRANINNLNCCMIQDAGRTQIEPNTKTVLAIGPAPNMSIDIVTAHLKLL